MMVLRCPVAERCACSYLEQVRDVSQNFPKSNYRNRILSGMDDDDYILDLVLADYDGKDIIKSLRRGHRMPIIVLSARSDDTEMALALNLGADDYVTKPFHPEVLLARINANLRKPRSKSANTTSIFNGPLVIDVDRHEVRVEDKLVAFSPKEYDLLKLLVSRKGEALSHRHIIAAIWGSGHSEDFQYLRVYIGQIRAKLKFAVALNGAIVAERGAYKMISLPDPRTMLAHSSSHAEATR